MPEYPHLMRLLQQLCGLENTDMELPLELLINVNRARLRRPLEAAAGLAPAGAIKAGLYREAAQAAEQVLDEIWPELAEGAIFYDNLEIGRLEERPRRLAVSELGLQRRQALAGNKPILAELISALDNGWGAQEPLVALHRLTWGPEFLQAILPWLEAQLTVHPDVADMLLVLGSR